MSACIASAGSRLGWTETFSATAQILGTATGRPVVASRSSVASTLRETCTRLQSTYCLPYFRPRHLVPLSSHRFIRLNSNRLIRPGSCHHFEPPSQTANRSFRLRPARLRWRGGGNSDSSSAQLRQYTPWFWIRSWARSQRRPHPSHTFKSTQKCFIFSPGTHVP